MINNLPIQQIKSQIRTGGPDDPKKIIRIFLSLLIRPSFELSKWTTFMLIAHLGLQGIGL